MSHRNTNIGSTGCGRRAAVTLELILAIPVLVIATLAAVEFGVMISNVQFVSLAGRNGAKIASETAGLSPAATAATVTAIKTAVDDDLLAMGFGPSASAGVRLQHTVSGGGSMAAGDCSEITTPVLPPDAVRVTVCIDMQKLAPDLLGSFGFTLSGRTLQMTTTYPYKP